MRPRSVLLPMVLLLGTLLPVLPAAAEQPRTFLIEAHQGGLGYRPGNTMAAFRTALRTGVGGIELDVQVTRDRRMVVTHDRRVSDTVCQDTTPATPGDPAFPYVGSYVKDLTFAQVRTLDCGSLTRPDRPWQRPAPGARMPLLADALDLLRRSRADTVAVSVELKVEAAAPEETAPRRQFATLAARDIRRSGIARQVTVRSFDWGVLRLLRHELPHVPRIGLSQPEFLETGMPGRSPWLGGLDIDDFGGSLPAAARFIGAAAIAPVHGNPQDGAVGDPGYRRFTTPAMVRDAHRLGLRVLPWTVNDVPTMRSLIDAGVDGITTDYPRTLRALAARYGYPLPPRYEPVARPAD